MEAETQTTKIPHVFPARSSRSVRWIEHRTGAMASYKGLSGTRSITQRTVSISSNEGVNPPPRATSPFINSRRSVTLAGFDIYIMLQYIHIQWHIIRTRLLRGLVVNKTTVLGNCGRLPPNPPDEVIVFYTGAMTSCFLLSVVFACNVSTLETIHTGLSLDIAIILLYNDVYSLYSRYRHRHRRPSSSILQSTVSFYLLQRLVRFAPAIN